jgi:hypothetical protein
MKTSLLQIAAIGLAVALSVTAFADSRSAATCAAYLTADQFFPI